MVWWWVRAIGGCWWLVVLVGGFVFVVVFVCVVVFVFFVCGGLRRSCSDRGLGCGVWCVVFGVWWCVRVRVVCCVLDGKSVV